MTRAQTMDVVNDSTSIQSRIDAVLGSADSDYDWSPDIKWWPGDPLYPHPRRRGAEWYSYESPVLETPHGYSPAGFGGGGNCVRHMVDAFDLEDEFDLFFSAIGDCRDCEVGIGWAEVDCWNCGKRVREKSRAREEHDAMVSIYQARRDRGRSRRRDEVTVEHEGHELPAHRIEWATTFLAENPDRSHVRIAIPQQNLYAQIMDTETPMALPVTSVVLDRRQVRELQSRLDQERHRLNRDSLNYEVSIRGMRPRLIVVDEANEDFGRNLIGILADANVRDAAEELLWSNGDLIEYSTADAQATSHLWGLDSGWLQLTQPRSSRTIQFLPSLEELRTNGVFDASLLERDLLRTREMIRWQPPTPPTPPMGMPLLWDDNPLQEWASRYLGVEFTPWQRLTINAWYGHDLDVEIPEPQIAEVDIPRVSLESIRPDLYRPGYKRFFESENSNDISQVVRRSHRPGIR